MIEQPDVHGAARVPCEVCLKEIPRSAALSFEDQDYVLYFCGADCYAEWTAEEREERTREAGEP